MVIADVCRHVPSCRSIYALACSAAVFLLPVLVMQGCSSFQAPSVTFHDIRLVDQSEDAGRVDIVLEVYNPNPEPLPLYMLSYRVALSGGPSYRSYRYAEATVPQKASSLVVVPAIMKTSGGPSAFDPAATYQFQLAGTLSYRAPGQLAQALFDTGFRVPTASFAVAGTYGPPSAAVP